MVKLNPWGWRDGFKSEECLPLSQMDLRSVGKFPAACNSSLRASNLLFLSPHTLPQHRTHGDLKKKKLKEVDNTGKEKGQRRHFWSFVVVSLARVDYKAVYKQSGSESIARLST